MRSFTLLISSRIGNPRYITRCAKWLLDRTPWWVIRLMAEAFCTRGQCRVQSNTINRAVPCRVEGKSFTEPKGLSQKKKKNTLISIKRHDTDVVFQRRIIVSTKKTGVKTWRFTCNSRKWSRPNNSVDNYLCLIAIICHYGEIYTFGIYYYQARIKEKLILWSLHNECRGRNGNQFIEGKTNRILHSMSACI